MRIPRTIDAWFARSTMRRAAFYGTRVTEEGLIFGTGDPDLRIDPEGTLLHEVAHFLEIDEARCLQYGFGLKLSKVVIGGEEFDEVASFAPCAREVRVTAIQRVLHRHFGVSFDDGYWAKLIDRWVPGSVFASQHYRDASLAVRGDYEGTLQRRMQRIQRDIVEQSEGVVLSDLWGVWRRRCGLHDDRFRPGQTATE